MKMMGKNYKKSPGYGGGRPNCGCCNYPWDKGRARERREWKKEYNLE